MGVVRKLPPVSAAGLDALEEEEKAASRFGGTAYAWRVVRCCVAAAMLAVLLSFLVQAVAFDQPTPPPMIGP